MGTTKKVCPPLSSYRQSNKLTESQSVKKRPSSAVKSRSKGKGKVIPRRHLQDPSRLELTILSQPKTSNSKRKSGPPIGPTITWSKVKCFALGLTVSHQWKYRKNGTTVTDWKAVLEVINDIYIQEFDDFKAIYPSGLTKAGKLRSEYSDRARGRHDKWRLKQDQCTAQEIYDMRRMARIVFSTEERLGQVPGSLVVSPRPGAANWVWYEVQPPKSAAEKAAENAARSAARKHKRKAKEESESEAEDEVEEEEEEEDSEEHEDSDGEADDDDNEEEEDSQEDAGGDASDEQECSTDKDAGEEESSSGSDDASDSDGDGDNIVVARRANHSRPIIVIDDEDEDAERASDEEVEEVFDNAAHEIFEMRNRAGRARSVARQALPQRKKTRLNLVQTADEVDEQPAHSRFFLDAFEDGAYGDTAYDFPAFPFEQSNESLQTLGNLELLPTVKARGDGALDNAVIQAKGAAATGTQGGLQITPARQNELLRRHKQSDMQALRYDEAMRFKGLAPPNYPPVQVLHDRILNPARAHDGDGTTDSLLSYYNLRRALIAAFQARRRIDFWVDTKRIMTQWHVVHDLINPMVLSTGMSSEDVTNGVFIASENNQIGSSIEFGQLLSMPTKIDQSKGEPNGTLENIVQQINSQTKLQMIHTKDVDFSTQPPTYTIRKHTSGSGNEFRFVRSSNTLYSQTGEVRRVLLTNETTGQGKEVDVMLCDKPLCKECDPQDDMFERNFNYAEQRRQLPLVHHKDVLMLEDKNLYFAPMQQGPVLYGATVIKRDIHQVIFGHGFSKAIFCDKARCRACRGVSCVASLVYPHAR